MKNSQKQHFYGELYNYTVMLKAVAYILEHKYGSSSFSNRLELQMKHLIYINERINQHMQLEGDFSPEICHERSQGLKTLRQEMSLRGVWPTVLPVEWLQSDVDVDADVESLTVPHSLFRRIFNNRHTAAPFINRRLGVSKIMESKEN